MAGINKVILVGNLGKDPEIRAIDGGRKVANFTLATTETYKNKNGEKVDQTEWHNVVFWGPIAEVIERFLKKGSQIYVEGKIRTRSYDDKDGNKRYITEILGEQMTMLGKASGGSSENAPVMSAPAMSSAPVTSSNTMSAADDDLPF
jgi:single-strand DNA-binding protein